MGMFDYYEPVPTVRCSRCGWAILEWQGKDGSNALFLWRQGHAGPVRQVVDEECRISAEKMAEHRLPSEFHISPAQVNCRFCPQYAVGRTENGVWSITEIIEPSE
jgi:hypothetical protein